MPSREPELYKDKVEVSLDGRQIFYLFFGGAVIVGMVFVLGVLVGRRVEARGHIDRARTHSATDPLAALDRLEGTGGALSFRGALTGKDSPSAVEKTIDEIEKSRKAKPEGKADAKAEAKTDAKAEPKVEHKTEGKTEVKPDAKHDAKPETKPAAKPEVKQVDGPVTKPDTDKKTTDAKKVETKTELAKVEAKKTDGAKTDAKAEPKAVTKSEGDAKKTDAKTDTAKKAEVAKADVKTDAKTEESKESKQRFTLQLSSFQDKTEAEAFLSTLKAQGYAAQITQAEVDGKGTFYRVRMGTYRSLEAANTAKSDFEKSAKKSASIMKL